MDNIRSWCRAAFLLAVLCVALLCVTLAIRWNAEGLAAIALLVENQSGWPLYLASALLLAACSAACHEILQVRSLSRDIARYLAENDTANSDLANEVRKDHLFWARICVGVAAFCATLELVACRSSQRPILIVLGLAMDVMVPGIVLYAVSRLRACDTFYRSTRDEDAMQASALTSPLGSISGRGGLA